MTLTALPISIVSIGFADRNPSSRRRGSIMAANDDVLPPDEWWMAQQKIPVDDVYRGDQIIAARLLCGGVDPEDLYGDPDPLRGKKVLALDGSWRQRGLGGQLRRWLGFPSQALARKKQVGREYGAFKKMKGIENIVQVRLTPPRHHIPLSKIRNAHASTSHELTTMIRAAVKKSGVRVDQVAAHFAKDKLLDDTAYFHFHLVTRDGDLDVFEEYFTENGWEVDVSEGSDNHSIYSLPQYLSAGLCATASEDWTHRQLAELFRQTHGLSLCRAVGEFRKWIHEELTKLDQVVDKDGKIRGRWRRDRPPRRPEWMFRSAGFRVLYETEWDFGDGVKCPAVIVDGRNVTVNEIAAVYNILRHNTAISGIIRLSRNTSMITDARMIRLPGLRWSRKPMIGVLGDPDQP